LLLGARTLDTDDDHFSGKACSSLVMPRIPG
jgi:hypothetical protein